MSEHDAVAIRRPRTDDRPLWDVLLGVWGYPAVLTLMLIVCTGLYRTFRRNHWL